MFGSDFDDIKRRLDEADNRSASQIERDTRDTVNRGNDHLRTQLKEAGLLTGDADKDKLVITRAGRQLRAYMEDVSLTEDNKVIPGSPLDRFLEGGKSQQEAIADGLRDYLEPIEAARSGKSSDYVDSKKKAMKGSKGPLPKGDGAKAPDGGKGKAQTQSETHNIGWDLMQEHLKRVGTGE